MLPNAQFAQWSVLSFLCLIVLVHLVEAIDPATTTGCYIHTQMKHLAEKEGCRPHEFIVRGCWGRCDTSEVPQLAPPFVKSNHPVCTYATHDVITIILPDCDPEVDPTYRYLSALSCGCQVMSERKVEYNYRPDFYLQAAEEQ